MMLQWRWALRGGHVHVAVYTTPARDRTWALAGTLLFTAAEWPAVISCLDGGHPGGIVFVEKPEVERVVHTPADDEQRRQGIPDRRTGVTDEIVVELLNVGFYPSPR